MNLRSSYVSVATCQSHVKQVGRGTSSGVAYLCVRSVSALITVSENNFAEIGKRCAVRRRGVGTVVEMVCRRLRLLCIIGSYGKVLRWPIRC